MISEELKLIVDKFNEQGKMNFLEETTEDKISEFEKEHNVKLPEKYKEWLLFSDGGELFLPAGIQLYGIEHKPVIDVDNNDRPSEDYIVIGALVSGDPILCEKDGERIAIYNQEAGRIEDDEIYDDFIAFLNDLYDLLGIGNAIAWIFAPLGWGNWQATVASITGLVAKENIVGTMGILYGGSGTVYGNLAQAFTSVSGYSFLVFNLLCAPCFAAIGAIKREMNNAKWTWFTIGYQCVFAYAVALMVNQFGLVFSGNVNVIGLIFALAVLVFMVYMLFKPYKESNKLTTKVSVKVSR